MEFKYWELRESMERAWDRRVAKPFNKETEQEYERARNRYYEFCVEILEKLMDENFDALAHL